MMVVLDMASMPPRKMQSIFDQPNTCPTTMPSNDMKKTMLMVLMMGEAPIFRIFLNEKSSPSENRRNMTPMSAQRWMFDISTTDAV